MLLGRGVGVPRGLALTTRPEPVYAETFPVGAGPSLADCREAMVADQVRRVPPVAGSVMSSWPAWRSARRRMLVSPLERLGVPMPRPLSVTCRVRTSWATLTETSTMLAWACRAQLDRASRVTARTSPARGSSTTRSMGPAKRRCGG